MKNRKSTMILLLCFFVGLSVMLYPSLANFWNSKHQSQAIVDYEKMLQNLPLQDYNAMFDAAEQYNRDLFALPDPLRQYRQLENYYELLDLDGKGMMGYVTIEKIGQELPLYHGTSDAVLSFAVGHMEGTSLPAGGENTHCVLSAHRGLPSAELFTYLDRLEVGDTFTLTVLDRVFTYEVDQIRIVQPTDASLIKVEEGQDHCTLLTCTPYGINTQRLLVRGKRISSAAAKPIHITSQAYRVDTLVVMPIVAMPMLAVLTLYVIFAPVKKETAGDDL
jgi:sortase A